MIKKNKKTTIKKPQSTYDKLVESLSPQKRLAFEKECKEFALSELLLAIMEEDEVSVRKLAKLAGVSPTVVQAMRSGADKDFSMKSFFKVLSGLGFTEFTVGRAGHEAIPLDISHLYKK